MTALAFLFFVEGQRAYFASLFGLTYDAIYPQVVGGRLGLALLPLVVLLVPLLPLARWADRRGAVVAAAAGLAIFRLPMSYPSFELRTIAAALVVGCGALFLTWGVGYIDRRAVAVGAVLGIVVDQLLRVAGTSYDLSMRPGWLPVQAVLTLGLLVVAFLWSRDDTPGTAADGLERRAGGLRLRSALALGTLLFLDLHLLSLSPVVSRWARVSWELSAVLVALASGVALAVVLLSRGAGRSRMLSLGLVVVLGLALFGGYYVVGTAVAVLMAAGHAAALLLIAATLNPASGRRGRGIVTLAMVIFAGLTALWSATFFYAYTSSLLEGFAPWLLGLAVLTLAGCFVLLPQPPELGRVGRPVTGVLAGLAPPAVAAALVWLLLPAEPPPLPPGELSGRQIASREIRVGTYNIHYGFDEAWRFDPDAIARVIARSGASIVSLQEVPVGLPTAYGADLPLWLERRLGIPAIFAPTINGLQGDAFLSELPALRIESIPLGDRLSDAAQLLRLNAVLDGRPLNFYATHLSPDEDVRTEQFRDVLRVVTPVRGVLMGDLNADPGSRLIQDLRNTGMTDAFDAAAVPPVATAPAISPRERIDWIWVRGFWVNDAFVMEETPSDHRMVVATLQVPGVGAR